LLYRIPEILFESNDVWRDITDEELHEIRHLIFVFMTSTITQRLFHAMAEVYTCVCEYNIACIGNNCGRALFMYVHLKSFC